MRPSHLLQVDQGTAIALDFDLACMHTVLEFENKRDLKRLESLVKSFAVLYAGIFGGDPAKLAESFRSGGDEEAEILDDDDPDVL